MKKNWVTIDGNHVLLEKQEKSKSKKTSNIIGFNELKSLKEKVKKFMESEKKSIEVIKKLERIAPKLEKDGYSVVQSDKGYNLKDSEGERLYMKDTDFKTFITKLTDDYQEK